MKTLCFISGLILGGGLMVFAFADSFSDREHYLGWESWHRQGHCLMYWRPDGDQEYPNTQRGKKLFCI